MKCVLLYIQNLQFFLLHKLSRNLVIDSRHPPLNRCLKQFVPIGLLWLLCSQIKSLTRSVSTLQHRNSLLLRVCKGLFQARQRILSTDGQITQRTHSKWWVFQAWHVTSCATLSKAFRFQTISKNNKMMAHLNFRMKVILQDSRTFVGYFKGNVFQSLWYIFVLI